MVNKLLESVSATFMLTAAAYAAGVVQNKELYRELGVQPELVSIDFQKALYDGGVIVFSELTSDLWLIFFFAISVGLVIAASCILPVVRNWAQVHGKSIAGCFSVLFYVILLWVIYDVSVSSFGRGREIGGKLAVHLKKECTVTDIRHEDGVVVGLCAIGRTTDLLWFYDSKHQRAIAFGKDKVVKLVITGE